MARKLTWFPWDVVRVETDEDWRLMSDEERGLYMRLMNHSWLNGGLPTNEDDLAELIGKPLTHPKWAKRVCRKFTLVDGRLVNPTQEEFRSKAISKSEKATNSVRTRYERSTEEPIRASDSVSISSSCSKSSSEELQTEERSVSRADAKTNGFDSPVSDWLDQRVSDHPNKKDWFIGQAALAKRFGACPDADREQFERNHKLWIESDKWRDKNGAFASKLWEFVESGEWEKPPPGMVLSGTATMKKKTKREDFY